MHVDPDPDYFLSIIKNIETISSNASNQIMALNEHLAEINKTWFSNWQGNRAKRLRGDCGQLQSELSSSISLLKTISNQAKTIGDDWEEIENKLY